MTIKKKLKKPLSIRSLIFFIWGQRNIFTVKKFVKSQESLWPTILNFVDFRGKRVFLLCKKVKRQHTPLSKA
jgi:hypothetical protein